MFQLACFKKVKKILLYNSEYRKYLCYTVQKCVCHYDFLPIYISTRLDTNRGGKGEQEYIGKARDADRKYNNTPEHQVGRVECKLVQLGEIHGLVCGNFGEISQPMHNLVAAMATSRVRVAGPLRGRRGILRSEEAERSVAVSSLRRRLGMATVKAQTLTLLGRLQSLGPGSRAGRRDQATQGLDVGGKIHGIG